MDKILKIGDKEYNIHPDVADILQSVSEERDSLIEELFLIKFNSSLKPSHAMYSKVIDDNFWDLS